jgi:hypothetical protein
MKAMNSELKTGRAGVCSVLSLAAGLLADGSAWADKVVLVAGGATAGDIPAKAAEAALHEPFGTDFDGDGNLWVVGMVSGNRLLKIDSTGMVSHGAGRRQAGFPERPGAQATGGRGWMRG